MVDIHSHIVFGVDDGARTIEDSLAMLELAAASGTTDIVATPHSDLRYQFDAALVTERIAEMQARIGDTAFGFTGAATFISSSTISRALPHGPLAIHHYQWPIGI